MKKALVFCAMDEFHHFARTNAWIAQVLRNDYDFIYAVTPISAACILSSADKVITDTVLTKHLYPDLLKVMDMSRNVYAYKTTMLFEKVSKYIEDQGLVLDMYMYTGTSDTNDDLNSIFKEKVKLINSEGIPEDFGLIEDFILRGGSILPYTEDVEEIAKAYNLPNLSTVCILTRNFDTKQPFYNSKYKELAKFIKKANKKGFNVINIGTPPINLRQQKKIKSILNKISRKVYFKPQPTYLELSNLDYSKTLAIVNACAVWSIVPHAGAFSVHINSKANLIINGKEFCMTDKGNYLFEVRKSRTDLLTYKNFSEFFGDFKKRRITSKTPESVSRAAHIIDLSNI